MAFLFSRFNPNYKKPVKIRAVYNGRFIGIVVSSLNDLKNKAKEKLKLSGQLTVVLLDGTEIEDEEYFESLPDQTQFVILRPGENYTPQRNLTIEEIMDSLMAKSSSQGRQEILDRLQAATDPTELAVLSKLLPGLEDGWKKENRRDDPDWFQDLNPVKYSTKDSYMRENASRRVRHYYQTAVDFLRKKKNLRHSLKQNFQGVLDDFFYELKQQDFHSDFFSRSSQNTQLKFCDDKGWFKCEGSYQETSCQHSHIINPYSSYHERIAFRTWELDHRIEKSREVLPCLLDAISQVPPNRRLNWQYFYNLLFTRHNLKCVYKVCHDLGEHSSEKCDQTHYYVRQ